MGKYHCPEKPKSQKDMIDQMWWMLHNHIPSILNFQNLKINFILVFMALVLGLVAGLIALVIW